MSIKYLSVCSGIEAASVAWHLLGWTPVAFSEIEKFPSAVLAHHYPNVPNLGDMTKFNEWKLNDSIDLLVGGTPCQAFSVAGLRKGLDDPRGSLTLTFLAMARKFRPRWIVWENVPGVLSDRTNAFGQFLGGLAELGYGCAYRVLDAQFFGVPQRRRRVFVVGYLGDWQRAAAVLFEPESLRGDSAPRREKGESVAPTISARTKGGGGLGTDAELDGALIPSWPLEISPTLNASFGDKQGLEDQHALNGGGYSFLAKCLSTKNQRNDFETETLILMNEVKSFNWQSGGDCCGLDLSDTAQAQTKGQVAAVMVPKMGVRRLTPTECERLQGFPDGYTNIREKTPDGPRYKALGNSMAVPVMSWIGKRIAFVDSLPK